eukprot:gb/GECG01007052.1/.p1 GENE.gb/GECG01007052.1/~~gb/GECG01007052.1/.p1  ORF type:complete len:1070 (+),score=198.98 gb/GECG01007052.1/:1-3210(+)
MASGDRKYLAGGATAGQAYQQSFRAVRATDPGIVDETQGLSLHNAAQFSFQAASSNLQASLDVEFLEKELEAWYRADGTVSETSDEDIPLGISGDGDQNLREERWAWDQPVDFEASDKTSLKWAMELLREENRAEGQMNLLNGNRYFGNRHLVDEHQSSASSAATDEDQQGSHTDGEEEEAQTERNQIMQHHDKLQRNQLDNAITELRTKSSAAQRTSYKKKEEDDSVNPFASSTPASPAASSSRTGPRELNDSSTSPTNAIGGKALASSSPRSECNSEPHAAEGRKSPERFKVSARARTSSAASSGSVIDKIVDAANELSKCRKRMDQLLEGSDAAALKLRKLHQRSQAPESDHKRSSANADRQTKKKRETLTAADLLNMHGEGSGNPFDSVFTTLPSHIDRVGSNVDKMRKLECSMVGSTGDAVSASRRRGQTSGISEDVVEELRSVLETSIRDLQTCEVDIQSLAETEKTTKRQARTTEQWLQKEVKDFRKEFFLKFQVLAEALKQFKQEFLSQGERNFAHVKLPRTASSNDLANEEKQAYDDFTALSPTANDRTGLAKGSEKSKTAMKPFLRDAWYICPQIDDRFHSALLLTPARKACHSLRQETETLRASLFGNHALEDYVNFLMLQNEKIASQLSASEHEVRVARSEADETKRKYNGLMEQLEEKLRLRTTDVENLERQKTELQNQNAELNRQIQELQHTLQSQQQFRAHSNHSPYSNSTGETPPSNVQTETSKTSSGAAIPALPGGKYRERRNTQHAYPVGRQSPSPSLRPDIPQDSRPKSVKGPTGLPGNFAGVTASRPRRATFSTGRRDGVTTSAEHVILASPAFTAQNSGQDTHTTAVSQGSGAPYKTPPSTMTGVGNRKLNERTFDTGFTLPANRAQIGAKESSKAQENQPQTILQYLRQQNDAAGAGAHESGSSSQKSKESYTTCTSSDKRNNRPARESAAAKTDTGAQQYNYRRPSAQFNEVFDAAQKEMNEDAGSWTTSSEEGERERWSNPTPDSEVSGSPKPLQFQNGEAQEDLDDEGVEGVPLERLSPLSRFKVMHELKAPDAQFDSEKEKEE